MAIVDGDTVPSTSIDGICTEKQTEGMSFDDVTTKWFIKRPGELCRSHGASSLHDMRLPHKECCFLIYKSIIAQVEWI